MRTLHLTTFVSAVLMLALCTASADQSTRPESGIDLAQAPKWSHADLEFFLHGSMSTEVIPERVLKAFIVTYPDLFPSRDLSNFGLIPDATFGWPIGISRKEVPHLGGLPSLGINCAACHVGDITFGAGAKPMRVLGMTSHVDAEAFFGAVAVATFRTGDATNMQRYLASYLAETNSRGNAKMLERFAYVWDQQKDKIAAAMAADPSGAKDAGPGGLPRIAAADVRMNDDMDLAAFAHSQLKLFHNMRAALHIPDKAPDTAPPASGPGRNDAFGLLSAVLFGTPQTYAPVKFGLVWNIDQRHWVHWDGNTQSPIARNLLAALGLGAPLIGNHGDLEFALVKRQTDLGETIRPPHYPLTIDAEAAKAGARHYQARCAACHNVPEGDARLHSPAEVGTQPQRAMGFTPKQAELFDKFLAELQIDGYTPPKEPGIRSTQKYWAPSLGGVWARSPYLHNGSVRTMRELLTSPADRAKSFHRGSHAYDSAQMGYADNGAYLLDTSAAQNSNAGHNYGTDLSDAEKTELIEYLKTL